MKVITIANQKGGVGKTTTAMMLAQGLIAKGFKTLLIDADTQGNATDLYKAKVDGEATLYDVLLDGVPIVEAVQKTESGDIVACDPLLSTMANRTALQDSLKLKKAVTGLEYDYVVIDTPPTPLDLMTINALAASDEIIIPVTAGRQSIQGLIQFYNDTIRVVTKFNPGLKLAGILLTKGTARPTKMQNAAQAELEKIAQQIGSKLFNTLIKSSVKVEEAQALRKPLGKYAPYCTTSLSYSAWIEEYLKG